MTCQSRTCKDVRKFYIMRTLTIIQQQNKHIFNKNILLPSDVKNKKQYCNKSLVLSSITIDKSEIKTLKITLWTLIDKYENWIKKNENLKFVNEKKNNTTK